MLRLIAPLLLLLGGCRQAEPVAAVPTSAVAAEPCRPLLFEGTRFTVCTSGAKQLSLAVSGTDGRPFGGFAALQRALGLRAEQVAFAMNAGMYGQDGLPIGLAVIDGRQLHPINRRSGGGNFHLQPNGVFLVQTDGRAAVIRTGQFAAKTEHLRLATQSGPMLVIDGAIHPRFDQDGTSRYVRNGVGVDAQGQAVFAISDDLVSFGKFARFFRDALGCANALYLDGSVSSLWNPANRRMDSFARLGPMIVDMRP